MHFVELKERLRRMAQLHAVMNDCDDAEDEYPVGVSAEYVANQEAIREELAGLVAMIVEAGQLTVYMENTMDVFGAITEGNLAHLVLEVKGSFPNGSIYLETGEIMGRD